MNTVPGGTIAGTTGKGKRLEAIKIDLKTQGVTGGIVYNTHVQSLGWTKDVSNNGVSGTTGQSKRIEAICMHLTGDITAYYDIYYRVHCQSLGWLDWAKMDRWQAQPMVENGWRQSRSSSSKGRKGTGGNGEAVCLY